MNESLIRYVLDEQSPDGSFRNLRSADPNDFSSGCVESTVFFTAQVLSITRDALPIEAKAKAAAFLKRQIHPNYATINYWPRGSELSKQKPYPDDWDDTACGWLALVSAGVALSGEDLAKLTASLIACESQPGGPYRTWLVPEHAEPVWRDLDIAVNANIAAFLSSQDVHLDGLNQYLDAAIDAGNCFSPYYPDPIPVLYFLTRARGKEKRDALISLWYRYRGVHRWGDVMRNAMAVTSLTRLGERVDASTILGEDAVRPVAFCLDPAEQGKPTYAGSGSLTAAFVLEALLAAKQNPAKPKAVDTEEELLHQEILSRASELCQTLPNLGMASAAFLQVLSEKDTRRHITLTPYRLVKALGRGDAREIAFQAGLGSVFGWAAYTLYDDVWDGDQPAAVLPLANLFHRRMTDVFERVTADRVFHDWWQGVLDQIDDANAFELNYCRFKIEQGRVLLPDSVPKGLEQALIARSLGHVIGPGAVLQSCGWPVDHPSSLALIEVYRSYILARQWHDDAHDWEADLRRGQWNAASFEILAHWKGGNPVDMETFITQARELFWMEVIPAYTARIVRLCEEAVASIRRIQGLQDPEILASMFHAPLAGAQQAIEERERTLSFLQTFPK